MSDFYSNASLKKEMLKDKDAIIFDMDGTLIDSMWMWKQIDIEYLGKYNIPLPDDLQNKIEGMSFFETAMYFKTHFPIEDSVEHMMDEWNHMAYDKYMHEVDLKPGVKEFLDGCIERGIKLGIATSNSKELVEAIAKVHHFENYFSCIMTAGEVGKGKPAPDIYLKVADYLGVPYDKCLVFEDIVKGIQAGKNAGMKVCAVEDVYSADTRLEKKQLADYYIEDYYDYF